MIKLEENDQNLLKNDWNIVKILKFCENDLNGWKWLN